MNIVVNDTAHGEAQTETDSGETMAKPVEAPFLLLNMRQVGKAMGDISKDTARRFVEAEGIPTIRIRGCGPFVTPKSLQDWIDSQIKSQIGGSRASTQAARELDALLEQRTGKKSPRSKPNGNSKRTRKSSGDE